MKARKHNNIPGCTYLTSATYLGNSIRNMYLEIMEEKEMANKFKIGDMVIANEKANKNIYYTITRSGWKGKVVESYWWDKTGSIRVVHYDGDGPSFCVDPDCFDLYIPHEGKILIMVDEKDPNKIIARDLITKKTAEAKCNPKDEWDFAKGAKLALERLYPEKKEEEEEKKPKYWSGKVMCVESDNYTMWRKNPLFTVGKVYEVKDGQLYDNDPPVPYTSQIESVDQLNSKLFHHRYRFIEFKGEASHV